MNRWTHAVLLCALGAAGYALSAQALPHLMQAVLALDCASGVFTATCRLGEDGPLRTDVYITSAAGAALAWGGAAALFRRRLIYPFVALFSLLALAAMAYDAGFGNRLVAGAKLANDTFNVLRFVIFASFVLTFVLLRRTPPRVVHAAGAIAVSYLGALAFMAAFLFLREQVMGALELLLLYGAYAFGGFTVHLMTVSLMVAGVDLKARQGGFGPSVTTPVSGAPQSRR